jgi:DNA-binding response OmpR family regulator
MPTVLLVADDDWVRNDVEAALSDPTTSVETIGDPRRVVHAAHDLGPDLFVVDMQIGSMGGMAVTRDLKDAFAAGLIEERPIVLLLDRSADAFLGKRAGADQWVLKPFTAQDLRAARDRAAARVTT